MITRLEFPDGIDMPRDPNQLNSECRKLLIAHVVELEFLETGVYDITPKIWTENTHAHELTVLDNGEGLYQMYPKDSEVGFTETAGGLSSFKRGGRMNPIDAEKPLHIVGGGHPNKPFLYIFGLIVYIR